MLWRNFRQSLMLLLMFLHLLLKNKRRKLQRWLLLANKNVLKARRFFPIRRHSEEVGIVGINIPYGVEIIIYMGLGDAFCISNPYKQKSRDEHYCKFLEELCFLD
uniref:Uncharacterized protein n=1 Tax=Cannabis sativa TaxID=3483 RepID=A0A803R4S1_CANSA